jgi:outer membrane immunogenic protein
MKTKTMLLASAAGMALMPNAQAADLPAKAPALSPAVSPNWTGFYVGLHAGAAWQKSQTNGTGYDCCRSLFPTSSDQSTTGFLGGGQIGYNWQNGNAVYGLEADISKLNGSVTGYSTITNKGTQSNISTSNKIDWLSTFRGRLGLAVGNAMAYATAGIAVGKVNNQLAITCGNGNCTPATWDDTSTRAGLVAGGGVATMLSPNWILRGEALYVDLGKSTGTSVTGNGNGVAATFTNQAVIARLGIDYRF